MCTLRDSKDPDEMLHSFIRVYNVCYDKNNRQRNLKKNRIYQSSISSTKFATMDFLRPTKSWSDNCFQSPLV